MAEQKTAQQAVSEQFKVAENVVRAWSDLAATTTQFTFGAFEKSFHYNQEFRAQADRVVHEALDNYRKVYLDGLETFQGYVEGVNEIVTRTS
jgi:pterin-4a-carbinolamine dehydratase